MSFCQRRLCTFLKVSQNEHNFDIFLFLIFFNSGDDIHCQNVLIPETSETSGEIFIKGSINSHPLNFTSRVAISTNVHHTFVQTDKYLYKPSQYVKFRILTIEGPKLKVMTEKVRIE